MIHYISTLFRYHFSTFVAHHQEVECIYVANGTCFTSKWTVSGHVQASLQLLYSVTSTVYHIHIYSAFFLGGRRGTRTPKHFVNLTGESKHFKMLKFPLNQLQTYYGRLRDLCPLTAFICSYLNHKMAIFLSQTESTPKYFFRKKKHYIYIYTHILPPDDGLQMGPKHVYVW
jgi:hypothetical protein